MSDLTIVTGIWDLGREKAGQGFERPFQHYMARFGELLAADVPMVVFGDEALRPFVEEHRGDRPTYFYERPASRFVENFDFYERVQEIRTDPAWLAQVSWLPNSTQASLPLYNPMVMSKMFMLHDASIANPFGTHHWAWIDGGITNTVHPGYFTHDRVFDRVEALLRRFFFVSFPYVDGPEIHGFSRPAMAEYCGEDPQYVCRGGFFGGHLDFLSEVNGHYYEVLSASLHQGYMGTEESIFTIMAHEEPELYQRFELEADHHALLSHFFEHVKGLPLVGEEPAPGDGVRRERPATGRVPIDIEGLTVAGYVVTFNAPDQLQAVLESWTTGFQFDALYVLDNSTEEEARGENQRLIERFGAIGLSHPKGNIGVCGARQFCAEHFAESGLDYCVYIEDDMLLNSADRQGVCRNGFRLSVPELRDVLLKIMASEEYDFLKLSFTEFFGDNKAQWAWYNVPASVRMDVWPDHKKRSRPGLDPNVPPTSFGKIGTVDGTSYVDGEVYYCNWPHIVSQDGNRRMFLDTVFEHPYEQTWMSHMYQLTHRGELRPAVLLASVVTHHRFHHYDGRHRREN